jgi:phosphoglycolate phosphatase-like HAD superfamily hydrolase
VKLVLFDIDGTLLLTDGAGRRAIHRAITVVFGSVAASEHMFDGKTDPQIVRELTRMAGHGDERIDAEMRALLDTYLGFLNEELADKRYRPYTLPGVPALLDRLEGQSDVTLGLLTGNVERGAHAKLRAVGLDPSRFKVGAFGSDHEHRPELPGIARERARRDLGFQFDGERIVLIGDTPSDVTCGRSLGARAIGVATGRFSVAELVRHGAYAAFQDLSDTESVTRAILEG